MGNNNIPGIFRKQYKIKTFNSKILKRVHLPKDLESVKKLFSENDNGEMELIDDIPDELFLLLKPLAKSIKKNSGLVSRWKFIILLVIVAGSVVFNLMFKDKLLTKGIESGLGSIFQADVKVENFHFSLLKGSVSYDSLIIADSENTLQNIIETGYSEFRINLIELTKKRVRIEEMSLTDFRWNTPRAEGAVSGDNSSDSKKDERTTEGVPDVLSIKEDDYSSILEQQKSNLTSIEVINRGNEETKKIVEKWELIYTEKDKEIKDLERDVVALKSLSDKGVNTVNEGMALSKNLTEMYTKISNTKENLLDLQDEYKQDKAALTALQDEIDSAVRADSNYIEGMVNLSSGDMKSLASDVVRQYIRNRWNEYYENAMKAFRVYEKFQDREVEESEPEKGLNRDSGRIIPFYAPEAPGCIAEHILLTGGDNNSGIFTAEISTLTNEPDKVSEPLTFLTSWENGESSISLTGLVDMRSNADLPFSMNIESPGNFVTLEEGISFLNISSLNTLASISGVSISEKNKEEVLTNLDISLTELDIKQSDEDSFISKTLKETLDDTKSIDLVAEVIVNRDGIKGIRVSSDFDNILSDSIGAYLDKIAGTMTEELENSLSDFISPSMEENENLESSVGDLDLKSVSQISSVDDLEKKTDSLMKEQEAKVEKFTTAAEDKVQEEASNLLDQATDKIKLPGF